MFCNFIILCQLKKYQNQLNNSLLDVLLMKKTIGLVGSRFLLIHYLRMPLKGNHRKKSSNLHNSKINKIQNNNNQCINNKCNKCFLKLNLYNSRLIINNNNSIKNIHLCILNHLFKGHQIKLLKMLNKINLCNL